MKAFRRAAGAALISLTFVCSGAASAAIIVTSDPVLFWNDVAQRTILTSPPAQSRAYAMMNAAMHDAVNAALGSPNHPYLPNVASPGGDTRAAASKAARDVLVHLNPASTADLDAALADSLALIPDGPAKSNGIATGTVYAAAIIADRMNDGSTATVPYTPSGLPGRWEPTPPAFGQAALPHWGSVEPFVMSSGDQFRPEPPPALDSPEYAAAYNEIKEVGAAESPSRTADQTASALFWNPANAGTWLRIGLTVAEDEDLTTIEFARLFGLLTTAAADSQIAGFDAKYFYDFWRPVTAIQKGETDGNALTVGDPAWVPLNAAPAHPSYISTLSALSAAVATTMLPLIGDEAFCSTVGENTRCFDGLGVAMLDAANSRLWGGIHFSFDSAAGLDIGRQIALRGLQGRAFNAVPEPETWALMLGGVALIGAARMYRSKAARPVA